MGEAAAANAAIVRAAFERGIDRSDPSVIGYHGTSVQTLRAAIQRGHLPVASGLGGVFGNASEADKFYGLHLVPNPSNRVVKSISFRRELIDKPYEDAMAWAKHTAARHVFFDRHGMDMDDKGHHRAAYRMYHGDDPYKATTGMRLGRGSPGAAPAGVVLAISERVAERFKVSMGGDGNDINVETNGLPLEYLTGVEPQNDAAYEWLDSI